MMNTDTITRFDRILYQAALKYYGLPENYDRIFTKQKGSDGWNSGLFSYIGDAEKASRLGQPCWVQINIPSQNFFKTKAANINIEVVKNITFDFELPANPGLCHQSGLEFAKRIVENGLAEPGLAVEDSGAGCHIAIPIVPLKTTEHGGGDTVHKAITLMVETHFKPIFAEVAKQFNLPSSVTIGSWDISRIFSLPGTYRPGGLKDGEVSYLQGGYIRRWLPPYDREYPQRKESRDLSDLIKAYIIRIQDAIEHKESGKPPERNKTYTNYEFENWLQNRIIKKPLSTDKSAAFHSVICAAWMRFGDEQLIRDNADYIDKVTGGKYGKRAGKMADLSLSKAMRYPRDKEVFFTFDPGKLEEETPPEQTTEPKPKHRYHADELDQLPPVEFLLEPYLQTNCQIMLVGESGAGKTFLGLHLALQVAEFSNVLYIACEDPSQYTERVKAWRKFYKPSACNFWLETQDLQLLDFKSVDSIIEENNDIQPVLVVIDTFHAATERADEISSQDMGIVLGHARRIQKAWNCTVMHVHHMNKSGTAERGHTSIKAAMRIQMRLSIDGDGVKLEYDKYRMGKKPEAQWFSWRKVDDAQVLIPADGPATDNKNLSNNDLEILRLLNSTAYREAGLTNKEIKANLRAMPERSVDHSLKKLEKLSLLYHPKERGNWFITNDGSQRLSSKRDEGNGLF